MECLPGFQWWVICKSLHAARAAAEREAWLQCTVPSQATTIVDHPCQKVWCPLQNPDNPKQRSMCQDCGGNCQVHAIMQESMEHNEHAAPLRTATASVGDRWLGFESLTPMEVQTESPEAAPTEVTSKVSE
eukprot:2809742-Amphidinium_carterae.1